MKECANCGYERQQKDDAIGIPLTECPRCGIIHDKIADSGSNVPPTPQSNQGKRLNESVPKRNTKTASRFIVGALIGIIVAIAVIHAAPYIKKTAIGRLFQDKTQIEASVRDVKIQAVLGNKGAQAFLRARRVAW